MRFQSMFVLTVLLAGTLVPVGSSHAQEAIDNTEISAFVHEAVLLFKQQREDTLNVIKDCRESVKNANGPEEVKQAREDCKTNLDAIKEMYKDMRQQMRELFKEHRQNVKMLIKEAKASLENETDDESESEDETDDESESEDETDDESESEDETKLEGRFDSVDDGKAKFELKDGRLKFSVEITDPAVVDGASYGIAVNDETFTAIAIGDIIELDLDSQCNDGPTDNNCWLNPVELSGTVTVTGPGISATAELA